MIGFFIDILKLFVAVWHGIKHDETFRILLAGLLAFLLGGTYFY
jgi:hypothetical protein